MQVTDDGSIVLNLSRFHCVIELKYRYKRKLISVSARAQARLGDANFNLRLGLTNNNGGFALAIQHVGVNAGDASIKILSGGIKGKFLNAIKSLFNKKIKSTMLTKIRDTLSSSLQSFASTFVSKVVLRSNVGSWGSVDLSLVNAIRYGANNIIVGFSGEIQDIDSKAGTGVARHDINFHPTDRLFSVGLDTFVFNSGFKTFYDRTAFNHVSTKAEPNGYQGVPLETNEWGKSIAELKTKFPNQEIRLVLRFGAAPVINSNGGQLKFNGMIHSHVQVGSGNNWADAFVIGTQLDAATTVALTNNVIIAQIQDVKTSLSVVSTNIGNIDVAVAVIQGLVQFTTDIAVPIINSQLLAGIPLPLNEHIVISGAALSLPENAIVFGADVDFNM